jgi:ribonuclease PH
MKVPQTVLKTGFIKQANGSAYIETQRTKIACAVWVRLQRPHSTIGTKLGLYSDTVHASQRVTHIMKLGS